jgi:hypothetical protein
MPMSTVVLDVKNGDADNTVPKAFGKSTLLAGQAKAKQGGSVLMQ